MGREGKGGKRWDDVGGGRGRGGRRRDGKGGHPNILLHPQFQFSRNMSARADYGVVRIDPLRFLTGWGKSRLNQALSVLSLSLGF